MPKRNNRESARKIAYAAVGTALSLAMIFMTAYLPLSIAPLLICALVWNVVIDKCGLGFGLASIAATVALGFLTVIGAGFAVMIIIGIVFVPYSLIAHFIDKLVYDKIWKAAARIGILAVFASVAFVCLYLTANQIMGVIDIGGIIGKVSGENFALGYAVLNMVAVAAVILIDFMYLNMRAYIVKRLR